MTDIVKALIVDEDIMSQKILQEYLSEQMNCETSNNYLEAKLRIQDRIAKKQNYRIVFLDIEVSNGKGLNLIKEIRQFENEYQLASENRSTIIIITATDDDQTIKRAFRMGCDHYLIKPVLKESLQTAIKNAGYSRTFFLSYSLNFHKIKKDWEIVPIFNNL